MLVRNLGALLGLKKMSLFYFALDLDDLISQKKRGYRLGSSDTGPWENAWAPSLAPSLPIALEMLLF